MNNKVGLLSTKKQVYYIQLKKEAGLTNLSLSFHKYLGREIYSMGLLLVVYGLTWISSLLNAAFHPLSPSLRVSYVVAEHPEE